MRVLHVINGLGPGGAETLLYSLVTRQSEIKHEVISLSGPDRYSSQLEEHGISVHHLAMKSIFSLFRENLRLSRLIRSSGANVLQTWLYRSNVIGGLHGRVARIPVVWGIHCSSLDTLGLGSRLVAHASGLIAPWIPDVIVNCSARSAELHDRMGYRAAPRVVIHNGYDQSKFYPDSAARAVTRQSLGISPDRFLIGSIGRWHVQKGIPILLQAVRIVRDRGRSFACLLVGRGLSPDNSELTALLARYGCGNFVEALGERSDIPNIARALDLHVLASVGSEAFPNVVGETLLSGTPNVVTDVGDSALMVGDAGWVVSPGDPRELADAIERAWCEWRDQPELWSSRRSAARRRIAENYTLDRMAKAYEEIWRTVAGPV